MSEATLEYRRVSDIKPKQPSKCCYCGSTRKKCRIATKQDFQYVDLSEDPKARHNFVGPKFPFNDEGEPQMHYVLCTNCGARTPITNFKKDAFRIFKMMSDATEEWREN